MATKDSTSSSAVEKHKSNGSGTAGTANGIPASPLRPVPASPLRPGHLWVERYHFDVGCPNVLPELEIFVLRIYLISLRLKDLAGHSL